MKRIAPCAEKAQGIVDVRSGTDEQVGGGELLSRMVRPASERVIQELLEEDQAEFPGRGRYERSERFFGHRNGHEEGRLQTAQGVFNVKAPQLRGLAEPYRPAIRSLPARSWRAAGPAGCLSAGRPRGLLAAAMKRLMERMCDRHRRARPPRGTAAWHPAPRRAAPRGSELMGP